MFRSTGILCPIVATLVVGEIIVFAFVIGHVVFVPLPISSAVGSVAALQASRLVARKLHGGPVRR